MSHTPGPWRAEWDDSGQWYIEPLGITGTAEAANAHLIAAVPEMFEALKAYSLLDDFHANCKECDGLGQPEACSECFPYADDARCKMRVAIAKAGTRA